jgi:hypothetical protein
MKTFSCYRKIRHIASLHLQGVQGWKWAGFSTCTLLKDVFSSLECEHLWSVDPKNVRWVTNLWNCRRKTASNILRHVRMFWKLPARLNCSRKSRVDVLRAKNWMWGLLNRKQVCYVLQHQRQLLCLFSSSECLYYTLFLYVRWYKNNIFLAEKFFVWLDWNAKS